LLPQREGETKTQEQKTLHEEAIFMGREFWARLK
jgi:hypothetical protein